MRKPAWWTEQDRIVLRCLMTGPKWSGDIAKALGFLQWSQIANGMYHGDRLVKYGLCKRELTMQPDGRRRVIFTINDRGLSVLDGRISP